MENIKIDKIKTVYFLGVGGIGMSALAHYFLQSGVNVFGYDLHPTAITDELSQHGAKLHFEEKVQAIPAQVDFVIHTPAVPIEHAEYQCFIKNKIPIYKRADVLGWLSQQFLNIAVAGTHGKTTITAMIAYLLHEEKRIMAFIGGIAKNFDTNFLTDANPEWVIEEADEYDKSFLKLFPDSAVISSIEPDHLDIYGNRENLETAFNLFANQIRNNGALIISEKASPKITYPFKFTYGFDPSSDYKISNIQFFPTYSTFVICYKKICFFNVKLSITGLHNVLNATAAFAVAHQLDIPAETAINKLSTFTGVKRRFDYQIVRDDFIFLDDYAHHPEELRALFTSLKQIYPDKPLTVVFQPHLYSRTRDFFEQFAEVLAIPDKIILLDIYFAREKPIEGVTSDALLALIRNKNKIVLPKEMLIPYLLQNKPVLLVTAGAGDISQSVPLIKQAFGNPSN